MDKEHVEKSIKAGLSVTKVINVPYKNLNDLLDEYCSEPDYLSIDIEGMDYSVLRTLDFDKYKIKVIIAEKTDEVNEKGETMDNFMEKKGYLVETVTKSNKVYRKA